VFRVHISFKQGLLGECDLLGEACGREGNGSGGVAGGGELSGEVRARTPQLSSEVLLEVGLAI